MHNTRFPIARCVFASCSNRVLLPENIGPRMSLSEPDEGRVGGVVGEEDVRCKGGIGGRGGEMGEYEYNRET